MCVPAPVVELNEANSVFSEPAGKKAIVGKGFLSGFGAIHLVDGFGLGVDRHDLRN